MFDASGRLRGFYSRLSSTDRRQIRQATLLVVVAIGLLFPVVIVLILVQGDRTAQHREELDRSFDRRMIIQNLLDTVQAAETGLLGVLLTSDQNFLWHFRRAEIALPEHVTALREATAGTSLEADAHRLDLFIIDRLAELNLISVVDQVAGPAAAIQLVRNRMGGRAADEIRSLVERMRVTEASNSRQLSAEVRRQAKISDAITLVLLAGIAIATMVAAATVADDLQRRSRIERDLNKASQLAQTAQLKAEQASTAKTDFLATMSHEIRTPLNGVIGYTELLLRSGDLTAELRDYALRIQSAGSALLTVVNDVLEFSKIEAGAVRLTFEPFALHVLVDNTVSIVRTGAEQKRLPICSVVDPELPEVLVGDAARLRQILLNLLNNALKFTDYGEVTLRVEHRGATESGECVRFSVTDTGPGIPKDQLDRLFKRFSQLDQSSSRRFGGTGLGLAICKRFVDLMGGEIGVESQEGVGSTFWFELSLPRGEMVTDIKPAESRVHYGRPARILVVDDLDQNRDLARKMLESAGHVVDTAPGASEAIAAIQVAPYDLVLMDIQMVGMDGVAATQLIRNLDHPAKNVPIIAMTANVLPQDVTAFRKAGMNDHLGKPYSPDELLAIVHAWLPWGDEHGEEVAPPAMREPAEIYDQGIEGLCELMGREWVVRGLSELLQQLDATFRSSAVDGIDRDELARNAHTLVSRCSVLGFSELSQLSIKLQQACRTGRDLPAIYAEARAESTNVYEMASRALERLEPAYGPR
ncbi:hybrid sensor histidine kinase/response regulator [Microvirga massiliensis]|uniref:hybrid sensor histidine kinase/response regulator n=1 Tax=Microvirga massiliensis TaxID=1033741 RepID=UPI00069B3AB6|nr:ATP-binding protein [Microvirga massiliensis]